MEFKLFEKYYPSNEGFLLGKVDESNLYGYIFHGFALVNIDGEKKYVSYDFQKPQLCFDETPDVKEVFRKKSEDRNNISLLIKLIDMMNFILIHYGNNLTSWEKVKKELAKDEYCETVSNFEVTIKTAIKKMFPGIIL